MTYENNINPGTARFTVNATENGNYTGSIKGTFQIREKPVKPGGTGGSGGGGGSFSRSLPKTAENNMGVTGIWTKMADGTWRFMQSGSTEYAANT